MWNSNVPSWINVPWIKMSLDCLELMSHKWERYSFPSKNKSISALSQHKCRQWGTWTKAKDGVFWDPLLEARAVASSTATMQFLRFLPVEPSDPLFPLRSKSQSQFAGLQINNTYGVFFFLLFLLLLCTNVKDMLIWIRYAPQPLM